jgi:tRNA G10  N-methylase Trm11
MKYAFVLGRVYTLSIAELFSIFEKPNSGVDISAGPLKILEASPEVVVIETVNPIQVEKLQKQLGGVIKILQVIDVVKKRDQDSINFALKHYFKPSVLKKQFLKEYKGKMQFGVSIYLLDMEVQAFGEPKRLGMMIKKALTDTGHSIRLVLPEFNSLALASVVVTKNLLLSKGAEICVLAGSDRIYTAKTLIVQDFEDYGRRDYQRPVRDEKQGMIPPKVAQIMLNLSNAKAGETVLDPFCGIGTIIQEGLLLGFRMLGSDINKQAVRGAELNLEWFRNRYKIAPGKYHLQTADATTVAPLLGEQSIASIVTESTLGPVYSEFPKPAEIAKNFKDLQKLYQDSLTEFAKFLPSKAKIVMCIPAYRKNRDEYFKLESLDFVADLGYNLVDIIPSALVKKLKFLKLTERNTAIYDRKDQIVAREIVVFEKI